MRATHFTKSRPAALARRRGRGIVLIEVLIAMLIFMFGVLGMVGLQASVTRAESDAKVRTDAAYLASEIVGRLWSDTTNMANYNGSGCTSVALCKEWQDKVTASLPNGSGSLTVSAAGDVTITITWTTTGGQVHQYVTNTTVVKA